MDLIESHGSLKVEEVSKKGQSVMIQERLNQPFLALKMEGDHGPKNVGGH